MHSNNSMKRAISVTLSAVVLLIAVVEAEVSFRASVDKVETAFEDAVMLDLVVTVSDASIETKPLSPPAMVGFRIGGSVSSVTQEREHVVRHYQYELIPVRSGPVEIPGFALEYSDTTGVDTLYSQPITVTVAQPAAQREEGGTSWVVLLISVVVLVVGVVWWIKRSAKGAGEQTEPDWQSEYSRRLEEATDLAQRQNYKEFFDKGSKLLVGLLERTFETQLRGKTVADLCEWMKQQELSEELKGMISDFLRTSERVKFTTGRVDPKTADGRVDELKKIVERLLA